MKLTMRQVFGIIDCMNVRTHNRYAADAALHGRKVKTIDVKRKTEETSPQDKEAILQITKMATQRKAMEKWQKLTQ
jgi:hypothetical protein